MGLKSILSILLLTVTCLSAQAQELPAYQQALQKFNTERASKPDPFSSEERAIMEQSARQLAKQMPSPGIQVGQKAPDFTLTDALGKRVNLYEQLELGPVVLVFYRGAWCPFCNLHLHVLSKYHQQFVDQGARLLAVTPQQPDKSLEQLEKDGFPFTILSDLDSKVMRAYRLYYPLDDKLLAVYRKHGLDIEAYNGPGRAVLPVPGTFVIDPEGKVVAMQADTDYTQRMEPEAILRALVEMPCSACQ